MNSYPDMQLCYRKKKHVRRADMTGYYSEISGVASLRKTDKCHFTTFMLL